MLRNAELHEYRECTKNINPNFLTILLKLIKINAFNLEMKYNSYNSTTLIDFVNSLFAGSGIHEIGEFFDSNVKRSKYTNIRYALNSIVKVSNKTYHVDTNTR